MLGSIIGAGIGAASSLFGGKSNNDAAAHQNALNYEHQKEFAQHGIRWKVADAKAAGLHPLAAIGGIGSSFTPSSFVGDNGIASAGSQLGAGIGDFIDGQNTKRAQNATATQAERELTDLAIERARLQNDQLRGQIGLLEAQRTSEWASVMGQPSNPPMPSAVNPAAKSAVVAVRGHKPALSNAGVIEGQPSVAISPSAGDSSVEAGKNPLWKAHQLSPGLSVNLPSQSAAEGLEAMPMGALPVMYTFDSANRVLRGRGDPPKTSLPPGYRWDWSILSQSWKPVRDSSAKYRKNLGLTRGR